jgi:hypothetical protein
MMESAESFIQAAKIVKKLGGKKVCILLRPMTTSLRQLYVHYLGHSGRWNSTGYGFWHSLYCCFLAFCLSIAAIPMTKVMALYVESLCE